MKTFTIENETNNITLHGSEKAAEAVPDSERFNSEAALAKLAANWPATRLVEIWNGLPGVTPVAKFKDRSTAVGRIWKALQTFAESAPAVPEEVEPTTTLLVEETVEAPKSEAASATSFEEATVARETVSSQAESFPNYCWMKGTYQVSVASLRDRWRRGLTRGGWGSRSGGRGRTAQPPPV